MTAIVTGQKTRNGVLSQSETAVRGEQEVESSARAELVPGLDRLGDSPCAEAEAAAEASVESSR